MVIVKKGGIQLHIRVEDGIKIRPFTNIPEILPSAKVVAGLFKTILKYYLSLDTGEDKIQVVKGYFKRKGWQVEN